MNLPRRYHPDRMVHEEMMVHALMHQVESMGKHPLLADALAKLDGVRDDLAEFVEWKRGPA